MKAFHYSVQIQHHLYRSAHGCELGCPGRRLPGSLPVRPVLERRYPRQCLGQLHLLHRGHAGQHVSPFQLPDPASVSHQCRRLLYDRRTDSGACGVSLHEKARQEGGGRCL